MIAVTLPIRTVSESNAHTHWRARHQRAKGQRGPTMLAVRAEITRACRNHETTIAAFVSQPIVFLARIAPRMLDDDNLCGALKAVRDGVADALGVDDRDPRVTWVYSQRRGKPKEYGVQIRIEPRAAERTGT